MKVSNGCGITVLVCKFKSFVKKVNGQIFTRIGPLEPEKLLFYRLYLKNFDLSLKLCICTYGHTKSFRYFRFKMCLNLVQMCLMLKCISLVSLVIKTTVFTLNWCF